MLLPAVSIIAKWILWSNSTRIRCASKTNAVCHRMDHTGACSRSPMNLRELLAKASPRRSGDELAGLAAANAEERVRAQMKLADLPLKAFLAEPVIPYEQDEVTRLICDSHDAAA